MEEKVQTLLEKKESLTGAITHLENVKRQQGNLPTTHYYKGIKEVLEGYEHFLSHVAKNSTLYSYVQGHLQTTQQKKINELVSEAIKKRGLKYQQVNGGAAKEFYQMLMSDECILEVVLGKNGLFCITICHPELIQIRREIWGNAMLNPRSI